MYQSPKTPKIINTQKGRQTSILGRNNTRAKSKSLLFLDTEYTLAFLPFSFEDLVFLHARVQSFSFSTFCLWWMAFVFGFSAGEKIKIPAVVKKKGFWYCLQRRWYRHRSGVYSLLIGCHTLSHTPLCSFFLVVVLFGLGLGTLNPFRWHESKRIGINRMHRYRKRQLHDPTQDHIDKNSKGTHLISWSCFGCFFFEFWILRKVLIYMFGKAKCRAEKEKATSQCSYLVYSFCSNLAIVLSWILLVPS